MPTTQNQASMWMMNRNWQVTIVYESNGLYQADTLVFTQNKIVSTHSASQNRSQNVNASLNGQTEWGTWSLSQDPNRLIGQTSAGVPFYIDYSVDQGVDRLTCYLATSQRRRLLREVAWSVLGGTLAGVAVGVVARAPFVGFLAGLAAAGTSTAVAFVQGVQGGPNATWVANDGGSGVPQPRPHEVPHEVPHTLKAVSA